MELAARREDETGAWREALLGKRREILTSLGLNCPQAHAGPISEEDQAQAIHAEFVCLQLNTLDYQQLRLVNEALDRLEAGDYGVCLGCDRPIPVRRLKALPWAKYCLECQEELAALEVEAGRGGWIQASVGSVV